MIYEGGCHCGAIHIAFESALDPAAIPVRECQCTFCRKHGTRAMTDAAGRLEIRASDGPAVNRYTFGLRTAEYLLCRCCGVYVAAVTMGVDAPRGIAIVNALDDWRRFTSEPVPTVYDAETQKQRIERRAASWTPASVQIGP